MVDASSLNSDVSTIISTQWNKRKGTTVPSTVNVTLVGGAVELDATFLYADLADSSKIAKELDKRIAAKILKTFLSCATKLIQNLGGTVISYDGDRVLGVFVGGYKNTSAAKCALQIKYTVDKIIRTKFEEKYSTVRGASFVITHGVGIDTGTVLIVRGGARGSNDLLSIGRAPNLAAKLSELRETRHKTFITADVYSVLAKEAKFGKNDKNMWTACTWTFLGEKISLYKSSWRWKP